MPASVHLVSLQARHWFLCVLSTVQSLPPAPPPWLLHMYCLLRLIDLCTNLNKGDNGEIDLFFTKKTLYRQVRSRV